MPDRGRKISINATNGGESYEFVMVPSLGRQRGMTTEI